MDITWETVKEEAAKLPRDGWPAVEQAIVVGEMLLVLKAATPHGEFEAKARRAALLSERQVQDIMSFARHRQLLEQHQPPSQRQALALIKQVNGVKPKPADARQDTAPAAPLRVADTFDNLAVQLGNAARTFVNDQSVMSALIKGEAAGEDCTIAKHIADIPAPKTWWSGPGPDAEHKTCRTVGIRFRVIAEPARWPTAVSSFFPKSAFYKVIVFNGLFATPGACFRIFPPISGRPALTAPAASSATAARARQVAAGGVAWRAQLCPFFGSGMGSDL